MFNQLNLDYIKTALLFTISPIVLGYGIIYFTIPWYLALPLVTFLTIVHTNKLFNRTTEFNTIRRNFMQLLLVSVVNSINDEWINHALEQVWPYLVEQVEERIRDSIQDVLKQYGAVVKTVRLGDKPIQLKILNCETIDQTGEVILEMQFNFANPNSKIKFSKLKFSAGVVNLALDGTLRIRFDQSILNSPFVGRVSVSFVGQPVIRQYDCTNIAKLLRLLDLMNIDSARDKINKIIADKMVYPNEVEFQLPKRI